MDMKKVPATSPASQTVPGVLRFRFFVNHLMREAQ